MLMHNNIARERIAFINSQTQQITWSDWVQTKRKSKKLEKLAQSWKRLSSNHNISVYTEMLSKEV